MSTTLTESDREILLRAAEIKEEKEHSQYSFGDGKTKVCMASALQLACDETPNVGSIAQVPEESRVQGITVRAGFDSTYEMCAFNNTHTKEECVEKFRELATSA